MHIFFSGQYLRLYSHGSQDAVKGSPKGRPAAAECGVSIQIVYRSPKNEKTKKTQKLTRMSSGRIDCATRGSPGGRLVWREYTTFRKAILLLFSKKIAKNPIALVNWGAGAAKGGPGRRLYVVPRHATLCFLHAHLAPKMPGGCATQFPVSTSTALR